MRQEKLRGPIRSGQAPGSVETLRGVPVGVPPRLSGVAAAAIPGGRSTVHHSQQHQERRGAVPQGGAISVVLSDAPAVVCDASWWEEQPARDWVRSQV